MGTSNFLTSTCSNCRFFNPEGHLHGNCQQLHVNVNGDWSACRLGAPAFLSLEELLAQQLEPDLRTLALPAPDRIWGKSLGCSIESQIPV